MQQNDTVMVIFGFSQLFILFIQNFELIGLRILISAVLAFTVLILPIKCHKPHVYLTKSPTAPYSITQVTLSTHE